MVQRRTDDLCAGGPQLREWQVAICAQVPEEEIANVELEVKHMYLTPILQQYELRVFWFEVRNLPHASGGRSR